MTAPIWWWVLLNILILGMPGLDLGVFHRKSREVGMREALAWPKGEALHAPGGPAVPGRTEGTAGGRV